ncbi:hypothetical protein V1512DRAFT_261400 [Lipomyces arxii]|uniref:uncharacterized protein n=1 Tax=Lipomyces arxii TaxID=56418 RepID=UPI0034CFD70F
MDRPLSSASISRTGRRTALQQSSLQSPSPLHSQQSTYRRPPSAAGFGSPRLSSAREFVGDDYLEFAVGDLVYVPGGMRGVVLYVGPIHGKVGEFAGIDLLGDDADKGKNNGTVNGIRYFNPSHSTSGLFVPFTKLSLTPPQDNGITSPGSISRPGSVLRSRASSRTSNRTDRSASPLPLQSAALHHAPPTNSARLETPRRRQSLANTIASGRTSRTGTARSSMFSPTAPANHTINGLQSTPRTTTPSTARRKSAIGTMPGSVSRLSRPSMLSMATEISDDEVPSLADGNGIKEQLQTQVADLQYELEQALNRFEAKDQELQRQTRILTEMENALSEYQALSDAAMKSDVVEDQDDGKLPTQREMDLRTLLQDKEATVEALTAELDSKRAEFRETMETLERANMASTHMYEAQLEDLRNKVSAATGMVGSIEPLEAMISELESSLEESHEIELRMKDELANLQKSAFAKDGQISQLNSKLEQMSLSTSSNEPLDDSVMRRLNNELDQEKERRVQLEKEVSDLERIIETKVFREQELERELVSVREQLSTALDSLSNERSQNRISGQSPLKPVSTVNLNGNTKPMNRTMSPVRKVLVCEICGAEGHDLIDCKSNGFSTATNTATTNTRKLWCALCERDGHSSMDCPYDGITM